MQQPYKSPIEQNVPRGAEMRLHLNTALMPVELFLGYQELNGFTCLRHCFASLTSFEQQWISSKQPWKRDYFLLLCLLAFLSGIVARTLCWRKCELQTDRACAGYVPDGVANIFPPQNVKQITAGHPDINGKCPKTTSNSNSDLAN